MARRGARLQAAAAPRAAHAQRGRGCGAAEWRYTSLTQPGRHAGESFAGTAHYSTLQLTTAHYSVGQYSAGSLQSLFVDETPLIVLDTVYTSVEQYKTAVQ